MVRGTDTATKKVIIVNVQVKGCDENIKIISIPSHFKLDGPLSLSVLPYFSSCSPLKYQI